MGLYFINGSLFFGVCWMDHPRILWATIMIAQFAILFTLKRQMRTHALAIATFVFGLSWLIISYYTLYGFEFADYRLGRMFYYVGFITPVAAFIFLLTQIRKSITAIACTLLISPISLLCGALNLGNYSSLLRHQENPFSGMGTIPEVCRIHVSGNCDVAVTDHGCNVFQISRVDRIGFGIEKFHYLGSPDTKLCGTAPEFKLIMIDPTHVTWNEGNKTKSIDIYQKDR